MNSALNRLAYGRSDHRTDERECVQQQRMNKYHRASAKMETRLIAIARQKPTEKKRKEVNLNEKGERKSSSSSEKFIRAE